MFSYLVTLAQQRQLEASPSALPAAFATIANDLTPGDNLNGDFVRFWRPGFVQLWTWRAATSRWERATAFIGAGEILAVSISALVGNFSDLNVADKLTAQHIDTDSIRADVFNVGKLFESTSGLWVGAPFRSVVQTVALADDLDDYDLLLIGYSEGRSSGDPAASAIVSTSRLLAGNVGIGHAEAAHIRYARGSNGRALNFTAASGNRHYLYAVYGLIVSVRSGRGMGAVKRISHVEAKPHKVLSFCW